MSKHIETHTQTGGILHTWHSARVKDKETGNWGTSIVGKQWG